MAEEQLKIQIGADVSGFNKGVSQVETGLKNLQPAAAKAGNVLTNLSRVASDAPFGFIAIQNNLEPLLQSFGSLQRESGSVGSAIKNLAASLAGPAGLAVGFSVVSSLVTSAIQKYGSLSNAITEFTSATDRASITQRTLSNAINEAIAGTSGEVAQLNNYVAILSDANVSQSQRVNAYKILKKEYPGVIQDMTTENALTSQGSALIRERSSELITYIRLKGKESALIKLIEEENKKGIQTAQSQLELIRNQDTFLSKLINTIAGNGVAAVGLARRLNQNNTELEGNVKTLNTFEEQLKAVQLELTKTDRKVVDFKAANKKPIELTPRKLNIARIAQSEEKAIRDINDRFKIQNAIQVPVDVQIPEATFEKLKKFGENAKAALDVRLFQERAQLIANVFTQVFSPAIDAFFENLNDGKNVLRTLGESVKAFVIGAIKQFVKLAAISGLVSLFTGASFGTSFKAVSGLSGGGGGFGRGFGGAAPLAGIAGAALSMNVSGQFVQRGTDLVAVVSQANQRIGRVG